MHYKGFTHRDCEYYPCHDGTELNCLFCFCPLYTRTCPGDYTVTERGIKDCSGCTFPHQPGNYDVIVAILAQDAAR